MRERAERMRDIEPACRVFGAWLQKQVDDGFAMSREFSGELFPVLATSTIDARIRRHGGFKLQKRSGLLTARAARTQAKFRAPGGIRALIDTGRARNSQHTVAHSSGLRWSAVGYLGPHMTGGANGRPPRRNPTPFERHGRAWALAPSAHDRFRRAVAAYVIRGTVTP